MSEKDTSQNPLASTVIRLANIIVVLVVFLIAALILLAIYIPAPVHVQKEKEGPQPDQNGLFTEAARKAAMEPKDHTLYWQAPTESELSEDLNKEKILYGKDLIVHTATYFGPKGNVSPGSTNGMNCQNCHLEAGTKVFGNNYAAVASTYPKYRARSGTIETIYKRVNDCFERSLNGKAIDTSSKEMQAIVTYIVWLGKQVPKGEKPPGSGFKDLPFLNRPADSDKGKIVYTTKCQTCHKTNGEGQYNNEQTAYLYPPLWGEHSYNDGAGLYRLSNFAKYVKYNMPQGASHNSPQLSDEEAWDVAAFVNSQKRPHANAKKDWPNISEKPFDHPFGQYSDGFDEKQHKFGPFQPIKDKLASLATAKKS